MRSKRLALAGDADVAIEYPIEVAFALGMLRMHFDEDRDLARQRRDQGWRFARLAWSIYGVPVAGCEAVYQRMVGGLDDGHGTGGDGGGEARVYALRQALKKAKGELTRFAPVPANRSPRAAKLAEIVELEKAIADLVGAQGRLSRRLKAMFAELRRPGESRELLNAVQNVVQYLRMPRLVLTRRQGIAPRRTDERELEMLRTGLQRLVDLDSARAKAA